MAMDPKVETARMIDGLGAAELHKAHDYTVGGHWLILWALVIGALVAWLIVRSGILDKVAAQFGGRPNRAVAVIAVVYSLASSILFLPWTIYSEWWREKGYGRSSQPFSDWLGQSLIGALIGTFIFAVFALAMYWLLRKTGRRWWLWTSGLAAALLAFMLLISPILIEPIFNQYRPIPAGEVNDAVSGMAKRAGIPENKVFVFDGSRQSNNFTANVSGIGGSARVAISDVALKGASLDEVRAVTGHEIGHYVLKHVWIGIAIIALIAAIVFFLIDRTYAWFARTFGTDAPLADPRGLPVLMFMASLFGTLAMPLTNTLVRIDEAQADDYSLRTENRPDALATALVKTAEYRYPRPGKLEEMIFYDHPSVERRVLNAMEWKAAHPEPPTP